MSWMLTKDEGLAVAELNSISDRAAAIVAAVLLENRIESSLKFHLLDHQKNSSESIHKYMFRNSGPLGSFSAKNYMAFMIGLYSADAWRDIDYIREIRNSFAHDLKIIDFQADSIKSLCNNITWFEKYIFEHGAKDEDTPHLLQKMFVENLQEHLNNSRKRYLLAVSFYVGSIFHYGDARTNKPLCTSRF